MVGEMVRKRFSVILWVLVATLSAASPASAVSEGLWKANSAPSAEDTGFSGVIARQVAPIARGLPHFAGIYLDNTRDGRAVVLLTERDARAESSMSALTPPIPGIEFVVVAHSYAQLVAAADAALAGWKDVAGHSAIAVSVSTMNNGLDVHVAWEDVTSAQGAIAAAEDAFGVPVHILGSDALQELACTDRDHCTTPMKAGNRVRKGSSVGTLCTMAFHIRIGTNEQFLMAGHCGYSGSNYWYHQGYGSAFLGSEQANGLTIGASPKFDIMRVEMPDAQASPKVYGVPNQIVGWQWPLNGQAVTVSAGVSDRVITNWVIDDYITYTNGNCGCSAKGTKTTQTSGGSPGDSGSPTFATDPPSLNAYAVGLGVVGGSGYDIVARIGDAIQWWGLGLVT